MESETLPLFPRWIVLGGLPLHLLEKGKSPAPWLLLRTVIELDQEHHPLAPGLVELPLRDLSERAGLDVARIDKALKVLRKEGLVRAFMPEHEEEIALFQVLTPLPVPAPLAEIVNAHPELLNSTPWPPRYATAGDPPSADLASGRLKKINRVVELYLDIFSMRMNNLVLEELQLIATRYDLPLVEKVFQRSRQAESRSLGWIVSEIRKETKLAAKAEELKKQSTTSAL
jgi:DNA-binding transcriptional ArsR family regulator